MSNVNFTESSKCPKCTYYTLFQHNDILIENFTIVLLFKQHDHDDGSRKKSLKVNKLTSSMT